MIQICNSRINTQVEIPDEFSTEPPEFPPANLSSFRIVVRHCEAEAGHAGEHYIYQNGNRWLWANQAGT